MISIKYKTLGAFDFDGVLADTEPLHQRAKEILAERLGVAKKPDYEASVGRPNRDFWLEVMADNKISGIEVEILEKRQYEIILEIAVERKLAPTPGLEEALKILSNPAVVLAVCSSSERWYLEKMLKILKLADYFHFLVGGDEVARKKPAPDVYLRALELSGVPAENAFAVEDSKAGVEAAAGAGLFTIGYKNPGSGQQNLSKADLIIDSMPELNERFIKKCINLK